MFLDNQMPEDCCGCAACSNICNFSAITMKQNAEGFYYPEVDKDKCRDCGMCQKVCPTAAINDDFVGDPAACIQCMKCVRVCPVGCRQMDMSAVRAYLESNYSVRRENEFFL